MRFIIGMVNTPTEATLLTALPEMVPNSAEPTTQILAGPARFRPIIATAMSLKNSPPPERISRSPSQMNMMTMVEPTTSGVP